MKVNRETRGTDLTTDRRRGEDLGQRGGRDCRATGQLNVDSSPLDWGPDVFQREARRLESHPDRASGAILNALYRGPEEVHGSACGEASKKGKMPHHMAQCPIRPNSRPGEQPRSEWSTLLRFAFGFNWTFGTACGLPAIARPRPPRMKACRTCD
jgi:hypothetical protein